MKLQRSVFPEELEDDTEGPYDGATDQSLCITSSEESRMSHAPRLTGTPIMRILSKTSGELVGYLYEWDNGDLQPAWFDGEVQGVLYEPIEAAA